MVEKITFGYAIWRKEFHKMQAEHLPYFREAELARAEVWQEIAATLCPEHNFEKILIYKDDKYDEYNYCCKKCGLTLNDYNIGDIGAERPHLSACHTCRWAIHESGDLVPYGSTYVLTPSGDYCEGFNEEEEEKFPNNNPLEFYCDSSDCPNWEGKIIKPEVK